MAASKTPYLRLLHIKGELDWMLDRFSGLSFEIFAADIVQLRAAERGLLIISEAAKALPDEMLVPYPHIEWHAVRAIGNVLRHNYEQIDPHRLWIILSVQLRPGDNRVAGETRAAEIKRCQHLTLINPQPARPQTAA